MEERTEKVRVHLRLRPPLSSKRAQTLVVGESTTGERNAVFEQQGGRNVSSYEFDVVHDTDQTNESVAEKVNASMQFRKNWVNGYTMTILAYGATGSGKTYTMGTGMYEEGGILQSIYREIAQDLESDIYMSYIEIYGGVITDLCSNSTRLQVFMTDKYVKVKGLLVTKIDSAEKVNDIVSRGNLNRTTAQTASNEHSSRSHAIITFYKLGRGQEPLAVDPQESNKIIVVDLAGSENTKVSIPRDIPPAKRAKLMKEASDINTSLSALNKVIMNLNKQTRATYREHNLTKVLRDGLGGNSITMMMACARSDSTSDMPTTLGTLRYAEQLRSVETRVTRNTKGKPALNVKMYKSAGAMDYIQAYQAELAKNRDLEALVKSLKETKDVLEQKVKDYEAHYGEMKSDVIHMYIPDISPVETLLSLFNELEISLPEDAPDEPTDMKTLDQFNALTTSLRNRVQLYIDYTDEVISTRRDLLDVMKEDDKRREPVENSLAELQVQKDKLVKIQSAFRGTDKMYGVTVRARVWDSLADMVDSESPDVEQDNLRTMVQDLQHQVRVSEELSQLAVERERALLMDAVKVADENVVHEVDGKTVPVERVGQLLSIIQQQGNTNRVLKNKLDALEGGKLRRVNRIGIQSLSVQRFFGRNMDMVYHFQQFMQKHRDGEAGRMNIKLS